jgi:hypothetical protein
LSHHHSDSDFLSALRDSLAESSRRDLGNIRQRRAIAIAQEQSRRLEPSTWSLLVRRSHDVGAHPGDERFPNRTKAATRFWSRRIPAATTNAGREREDVSGLTNRRLGY